MASVPTDPQHFMEKVQTRQRETETQVPNPRFAAWWRMSRNAMGSTTMTPCILLASFTGKEISAIVFE